MTNLIIDTTLQTSIIISFVQDLMRLSFTLLSAYRRYMIRINLTKSSVLAALILAASASSVSTKCSAQDFNASQAPVQQQQKSAELESADSRVEQTKTKLDQARKVLSAAKASLKAAEAEFKATKADRDAIALRATAQQLADSSGFASTTPVDSVRQIIVPPNGGNRLTPVSTSQLPVPLKATPAVDFNAAPPAGSGDLTPAPTSTEPYSVP
jgi:hypothetical protein